MQSLIPTPKDIESTVIPDTPWYTGLTGRMGVFAVRDRLARERLLRLNMAPLFRYPDGLADRRLFVRILGTLIRCSLLSGRARRNFETIRRVEREWVLSGLAKEMDGFRLLQVSDLHLDFDPGTLDRLEQALETLEYDAVCLTGDFYDLVFEEESMDLALLDRLVSLFPGPSYAVLGNHDIVAVAEHLERRGVRVLMNESEWIGRDGAGMVLAGVDDPRQYQTDSIERSLEGRARELPTVLLAHSPQVYREASQFGVDLMLSGHTHGGQVALPGRFTHAKRFKVPRAMVSGAWRFQGLQGYTSNGCGGCKLPYRINAPAEISVHTLRAESR